MKKLISTLLLLSMVLAFAGCGQTGGTETSNATTDDTTETAVDATAQGSIAPDPTQAPMAAVSIPSVTETTNADDGTILFNYSYQHMALTLPDPEVVDNVIIDFLNRVDSTASIAESIGTSALADYSGTADWVPYLCDVSYSPTRIDQGVLSLFGTIATYSGGMHPDQTCVSASYDLITGDVLTLASIMSPEATGDSFCQLVLDELAAHEDELYEGYASTVVQRFSGDASQDENWYFTQTGLCFYFSPYEIAPYASGIITVEIPYEKLTGLMYDGYFPAEQDTASGTISAQLFGSAELDSFTQIAELTLDAGGEKILLYTDSSVQNVRIDVGFWDDSRFYSSYTAFATYTLTPGDAVMVETYIPDGEPNLRLTYQTGDETVTVYISQSGKDGSILLLS